MNTQETRVTLVSLCMVHNEMFFSCPCLVTSSLPLEDVARMMAKAIKIYCKSEKIDLDPKNWERLVEAIPSFFWKQFGIFEVSAKIADDYALSFLD